MLRTRAPLYSETEVSFPVRLACVKYAASVRSEPRSNSPFRILRVFETQRLLKLRSRPSHRRHVSVCDFQRPSERAVLGRSNVVRETIAGHFFFVNALRWQDRANLRQNPLSSAPQALLTAYHHVYYQLDGLALFLLKKSSQWPFYPSFSPAAAVVFDGATTHFACRITRSAPAFGYLVFPQVRSHGQPTPTL